MFPHTYPTGRASSFEKLILQHAPKKITDKTVCAQGY
jgi:hypothetical protein